MSEIVEKCINNAYGDNLKNLSSLKKRKGIETYEITQNEDDKKEIVKVIKKECFNSSFLSEFKKNVELINLKCLSNGNILVSNIFCDNSDYLMLYRRRGDNRLEKMNETELKVFFKENSVYEFLKTIIEVIKLFHENGLYHGGLKLSNVMIKECSDENDKKEYEICDYFNHLLNGKELDINENNVNYLSPEELLNKEMNEKKDLWNIGVLLYKIVSGKYPFDDETIDKIKSNILNVKFDDLDVEFSELINPLIHKLLLIESENRISIEEFETEINGIYSVNVIDNVIPFIDEAKFVEENKHQYISISEDGKTIINTVGSGIFSICNAKCNLNVIISKDIHHFLFTIKHGNNGVCFGCSCNNNDKQSCSIALLSDYSYLHGSHGNKMKEGQFSDVYAKEGEEYEVIFNLNQNTMLIKQRDGNEVLLFTDIRTPVCPYASILYKDDSVSLIKYWKE